MEGKVKKNKKGMGNVRTLGNYGGGTVTLQDTAMQQRPAKQAIRKVAAQPQKKTTTRIVKIGTVDIREKWRCKVCTFTNEHDTKICQTCQSTRGQTKDQARREQLQEMRRAESGQARQPISEEEEEEQQEEKKRISD